MSYGGDVIGVTTSIINGMEKHMHYRYLGKTGLKVSELCLGTMTFGREADEATSHAILDRFVAAGGTFIDTANVYGRGRSEEVVGGWLRGKEGFQAQTAGFFDALAGAVHARERSIDVVLSVGVVPPELRAPLLGCTPTPPEIRHAHSGLWCAGREGIEPRSKPSHSTSGTSKWRLDGALLLAIVAWARRSMPSPIDFQQT